MSNEEDTNQDATGTVPDPGIASSGVMFYVKDGVLNCRWSDGTTFIVGCAAKPTRWQRLVVWLKSLFGK